MTCIDFHNSGINSDNDRKNTIELENANCDSCRQVCGDSDDGQMEVILMVTRDKKETEDKFLKEK